MMARDSPHRNFGSCDGFVKCYVVAGNVESVGQGPPEIESHTDFVGVVVRQVDETVSKGVDPYFKIWDLMVSLIFLEKADAEEIPRLCEVFSSPIFVIRVFSISIVIIKLRIKPCDGLLEVFSPP
jgi:hypothetical protein